MTTSALDIYNSTLEEQLGPDGVFTETAIYDPDGDSVELSGVFDETSFSEDKGGGNVEQKKQGPHFVVAEIDFSFDLYSDKKIYFPYRDKTFTIQEIKEDANGAQVIWLA